MTNFFQRLFGRDSGSEGPSKSAPTGPSLRTSFEAASADDEIVRLLDPEETEELRHRFLTGRFQKAVERCFAAEPSMQSMTLMVGQYWCDEAVDAVQASLVCSQLETPDIEAARVSNGEEPDAVNLGDRSQWDFIHYESSPLIDWPSNSFVISLFAAYCVEGGHQEGEFLEFESPVATYRRTGPKTVAMEFLGQMVRPWLDGVAFLYSEEALDRSSFEQWIDEASGRRW